MKNQPVILRRHSSADLLVAGASPHTPTSAYAPLQSPDPSRSSSQWLAVLTESMYVERIVTSLKQGSLGATRRHLCRISPKTAVQVLYHCHENSHAGQRFVDLVASDCPGFQHDSESLSEAIHVLVRGRRFSEAQALVLRMVRSGASRVERRRLWCWN